MSYILDSGVDIDRSLTSEDLMELCRIVVMGSSMTQEQFAKVTGIGFNTVISAACRNPHPKWDYARQRIIEWDLNREITKIVTIRTQGDEVQREIRWQL